MNDDIKDIDKIAEMVANSEELRIAIMDKMMAKYERNLEKAESYHEGEKQGEKRGEKIGEKNASIEIAKKMKKEKFDISTIEKLTGLTKEEIEKL